MKRSTDALHWRRSISPRPRSVSAYGHSVTVSSCAASPSWTIFTSSKTARSWSARCWRRSPSPLRFNRSPKGLSRSVSTSRKCSSTPPSKRLETVLSANAAACARCSGMTPSDPSVPTLSWSANTSALPSSLNPLPSAKMLSRTPRNEKDCYFLTIRNGLYSGRKGRNGPHLLRGLQSLL